MPRHFYTLSPDKQVIVVAISGERSGPDVDAALNGFRAFYADNPTGRILFDLSGANVHMAPPDLVGDTERIGKLFPTARVAILSPHLESTFARIWRRGLKSAGHDAQVFDHSGEADAWLRSGEDDETVYIY